MAATFMDFIKFGLDRKDLSQWQQIKWYLCQKFDSKLKNLLNLPKRIGELCTYDIINWVLSDNQSMYNASIKLCTLIGYITNYD